MDTCPSHERQTNEETPNDAEDKVALATYIAEMCNELAALSNREGLPMLSYFLSLARAEAEIISQRPQ